MSKISLKLTGEPISSNLTERERSRERRRQSSAKWATIVIGVPGFQGAMLSKETSIEDQISEEREISLHFLHTLSNFQISDRGEHTFTRPPDEYSRISNRSSFGRRRIGDRRPV